MQELLLTAPAAIAFALVHALSPRLTFLDRTPRSIWLSIAGGVSTAYVFVHLLPELAAMQDRLADEVQLRLEALVYAIALSGLVLFYGLDKYVRARTGGGEDHASPPGIYRVHLGSFAIYNFLIAYLLPEQLEQGGVQGLALYAFALGLHYVVNDRALYRHHGPRYLAGGRWVLAAAALAGWLGAELVRIPLLAVETIIALLGGGVILNVIKEELPEDRESRFSAFAVGAAAYAALLIAA